MNLSTNVGCSVPILTLNAAGGLERCLNSIKDFEEIILLDGNSTDGTQEIGRRYGAKIFRQKDTNEPNIKIDDFTEMRLKSIAQTTLLWILDLDSDEYISDELHEEIRAIVNNPASDPMLAYDIARKAVIDGRVIEYAHFYPDLYTRLYHKQSGITFKKGKKVHEKLFIPQGVMIKRLKGCVYAPWKPYDEQLKKDDYYLRLATGNFTEKKTPHIRFNLLRSAIKNMLMAVYIGGKASCIYFCHGFKKTLPPKYTWRFMRYHLIMGKIRFMQAVN